MSEVMAFFYEGGGRRMAVDALFEGIHRDDAVVLLVGPPGCGRSAVLRRFVMEVDPAVLVVGLVAGDILMSADQCSLALAASFGGQDEDEATADGGGDTARGHDARAALLDALATIRATGRSPVAIVDDAHELGEEARDDILAICREAAVPLVLAGDDSLPALLDPESGYTTIALRAFTEDETEDFVAGWLTVGDEDELPSHRAMARLHRQAGGMPGKLAEALQSGAATRTALLPAGFPVWHLAFTLAAVALLLWLLVRTESAPVATPAVVVAEIPVTLPPPREVTTASVVGVVPAMGVAGVAVPQPVVVSTPSPEEPAGSPAASTAPAPAAPSVARAAAPAARAAASHEPVPVPAPVREPQKTGRKFSVDEDALLKEKSSRFTLQLFASFNEDAARQFKTHHAGLEIRTFRTSREDLPWYVAVTGVHRNKDEAKAAVAKLPAELQKLKPWPRSLQGIQDELRRRKD